MEGHLGRTAERLNVAQSALSIQIKQLEASIGHALFDRIGRRLVLTEAGQIALDHANRIFGTGDALLASLRLAGDPDTPLRVGAQSTLSRNFQLQFLRPLIAQTAGSFVLRSGGTAQLLRDLEGLALDVVLTTQLPNPSDATPFAAQRIAEQSVRLHGKPERLHHASLRALLENEPLIVPTESTIHTGFQNLVANLGVTPRIAADVDDMAMVRLLAREGVGLALAPSVVVADEIKAGLLATAPFDLGINEPFFAVTLPRKFAHPALRGLLERHGG